MAHLTSPETEVVDVYDSAFNVIGQFTRAEAIAKNLLFRSFHCWFVSSGQPPFILFQKRGPDKDLYPSHIDVALAGHYAAGEGLDGIVREAREELQLTISEQNLRYLGRRFEALPRMRKVALLFNEIYFYEVDDPSNLTANQPEVSGVYKMRCDDALNLFSARKNSAEMLAVVSESAKPIEVRREQFVPRHDQYYLSNILLINFLRENNIWELQ